MKKYILSLLLFIAAYIVAMYLTQEYTTLKPAGSAPARLSDFFANLKPKKYTKDLNRLTQIATKRMTPQQEQEERPFYLCLYDCYRPLSAQQALWDIHPVPGQVANPKTGSNHNRGTAVDLGPCDYQGYPLQTPTPFDDFSENAYAYAKEGIPQEAIRNRSALQKVMRTALQLYARNGGTSITKTQKITR